MLDYAIDIKSDYAEIQVIKLFICIRE